MNAKLALAAAALLALAACSSGEPESGSDTIFNEGPAGSTTKAEPPTDSKSEGKSDEEPRSGGGSGDLPNVDVLDISTGEELALASLVPAERPLLVWFWAPH